MTVSTEINHEEFVGNGITTVFPYRFRILKASNMVVVTIDADGNETNMVLNTDFTVSGAGSYNGGNVTLSTPLPLGWVVTLTRQLALVQETDLRNQGTFFAEMHENAFDYLTMLIQQSVLWSDLSLRRQTFLSQFFNAEGRRVSNAGNPTLPQDLATKLYTDTLAQSVDAHTLRVPEASIPILPIASLRANKVLTFDGAGNAIVTVPASGSAADVFIELAKPTGSALVGVDGGGTVEDSLIAIYTELGEKLDKSGGTLIGRLTVQADAAPVILKAKNPNSALYLLAQQSDGSAAWYLGMPVDGNNRLALRSSANNCEISLSSGRGDITVPLYIEGGKAYYPGNKPPLTNVWVSGEYTPVMGTPTVVNHGLAGIDVLHCKADVLLKCVVTDAGYSPGDFAAGWSIHSSANAATVAFPALSSTTIQTNTGAAGTGLLVNGKGGGGSYSAVLANWRYILRIFY